VHSYGGVRFVNCGSVGKPKDGDPRGAFAILSAAPAGIEVTIEQATRLTTVTSIGISE
jgi:hypothetical protein